MPHISKKTRSHHGDRRRPSHYAEHKDLSTVDRELVVNFELSETEFRRYKHLEPYKKAEIIHLLAERKRLTDIVKNHLQEEINEQSGPVMQLLFPSEHTVKYALQKVDEIEHKINQHLGEEVLHLFDKISTKRNRLELLLNAAYSYLEKLDKKIAKTGHGALKGKALTAIEEKRQNLSDIIEDLHQQLDRAEYFIHNKDLLKIQDFELNSFIYKLKLIEIGGFEPKPRKYQITFFNINILTSIFEKITPSASPEQDSELDNHSSKSNHRKR